MVGLYVDPLFYRIGTPSFFNSFFSSITFNLENNQRGAKYPMMLELYNGVLKFENINRAKLELNIIKQEFSKLTTDKIVWDNTDLTKKTPWGNNIADRVTNLSNYFWTSDGKDLFEILNKAFDSAVEIKENVVVRNL